MKLGAEAILKSLVGDKGIETLSKAIFRRQTESVADPMELYLPLMVVPRALLSWLVQTIRPLKVGEHKDFEMPGQPGVVFHVEKQSSDVYRGEIIREGRVIHSFDKQSLPSIGGHLMTVFENYDHLQDAPKEEPKEKAPEQNSEEKAADVPKMTVAEPPDSGGVVRTIMNMNGISVESTERGAVQSMMQLASIKALTESIGELVDALVMRRSSESIDKKEIKPDDGKVKESEMPQPKKIEEGQSLDEVRTASMKMDAEKQAKIMSTDYDPKVMKEGEQAADAAPKIEKDEMLAAAPKRNLRSLMPVKKDDISPGLGGQTMAAGGPSTGMAKAGLAVKPAPQPNAVPVGAGGVKPGLKQPKGAMAIPVIKEELDKAIGGPMKPGGAGMPKGPGAPMMPKGPTPPSNKPSAAQKQTQISATGGQAKPAAGSMNKPISNNPGQQTMKPKMSAMKAEVAGYSTSNPPGKEIPKIMDRPASHPGKRSLRSLIHGDRPAQAMGKSETFVSEQELFQKCEHCGRAEFEKSAGNVRFSPCACFVAMTKDDEGQPTNFVALRKTENGYKVSFSPEADPDAVKAFLLLMKSKILIKKRFGV